MCKTDAVGVKRDASDHRSFQSTKDSMEPHLVTLPLDEVHGGLQNVAPCCGDELSKRLREKAAGAEAQAAVHAVGRQLEGLLPCVMLLPPQLHGDEKRRQLNVELAKGAKAGAQGAELNLAICAPAAEASYANRPNMVQMDHCVSGDRLGRAESSHVWARWLLRCQQSGCASFTVNVGHHAPNCAPGPAPA